MRAFAAVSFGLLLTTTACGYSVTYTATNKSPRQLSARKASTVEVLTVAPPARPFVEVGLFEIEEDAPDVGSPPEMMARLREEAAEVGCDAVVITKDSARITNATSSHTGTITSTPGGANVRGTSTHDVKVRRGKHATCIVYKDGDS